MIKGSSTMSVKELNKRAMTAFLYTHGPATKQMLERELGLSLPTITQNLRILEDEGLVHKAEQLDSTGGRKAQTFAFTPTHRAAIGVTMRSSGLTMCAVDLSGEVIARRVRLISYRNTDSYYQQMGTIINSFAQSVAKNCGQVLGVAFSIQGIVDASGTTITFGKIMQNTGLSLDEIAQNVDYPCIMIHDSDAAAMAELWFDHSLSDAVCVYLDRRPGGAVIVSGALYQGPNLCNGTIEHMTLIPGGKLCYCGQHGCMDVYCSPETLAEDGESLSGFFSVLEQGEQEHRRRFNEWLGNVAQAICNIRGLLAGDIIIGGETAHFLDEHDIAHLRELVEERSAFHTDHFALRKSLCLDDQNEIGAALRFVQSYIDEVCSAI